jgi:hypothetical protein
VQTIYFSGYNVNLPQNIISLGEINVLGFTLKDKGLEKKLADEYFTAEARILLP